MSLCCRDKNYEMFCLPAMILYVPVISVLILKAVVSKDYSYPKEIDKAILKECKNFIPRLSTEQYKGDRGRLGVFGGSTEYTGAPYFGAMASLRTGADMVFVFCSSPAAVAIKCYSPELMVLPCLDSERALETIKPWLSRLHGILVGPGLGRNNTVTQNIVDMIEYLKEDDDGAIPLVFDADAFYILYSNTDLLRGYPNQVYLTPNLNEFKHLAMTILAVKDLDTVDPQYHLKMLSDKLGPKVTILLKGKNDMIAHGDIVTRSKLSGSPRRSGGQGDLLAGCLTTLAVWLDMAEFWRPKLQLTHEQLVGYAASAILKVASERTYKEKGRSLIASDILQELHNAFNIVFDEV